MIACLFSWLSSEHNSRDHKPAGVKTMKDTLKHQGWMPTQVVGGCLRTKQQLMDQGVTAQQLADAEADLKKDKEKGLILLSPNASQVEQDLFAGNIFLECHEGQHRSVNAHAVRCVVTNSGVKTQWLTGSAIFCAFCLCRIKAAKQLAAENRQLAAAHGLAAIAKVSNYHENQIRSCIYKDLTPMQQVAMSAAANETSVVNVASSTRDKLMQMMRICEAYNATQEAKKDDKRFDPATVSLGQLNAAQNLRPGGVPTAADDTANGTLSNKVHNAFRAMMKYGSEILQPAEGNTTATKAAQLLDPTDVNQSPDVMLLHHAAVTITALGANKRIPTAVALQQMRQVPSNGMVSVPLSIASFIFARVIHCQLLTKEKAKQCSAAQLNKEAPWYLKVSADAEKRAHDAAAVYMVLLKTARQ
jgi:hypothetical protein